MDPGAVEAHRCPARVVLATPCEDDRDEFFARVRDSAALHRSWVHLPDEPERWSELVARSRLDTYETYLARRTEDAALVGYLNISNIVRGSLQGATLGYAAFEPFAGRGYMSQALALVLDDAFGRLDLHRLEANIQPHNVASIALVRRAGFEREGFSPRYLKIAGHWRDHERWAIRSETWQSRRSQAGVATAGADV